MSHPHSVTKISPAAFLAAWLLFTSAGAVAQTGAKPAASPQPAGDASLTSTPSSIRFGSAEPRPRTPGTFRLATFNIENLFDDKDDPALSGRYEDKDQAKPAAHCKAAADAIRRIDADVLALEEIESKEALLAFRDTYLAGLGYDNVVSIDAGDERGIEQAVLSRFPITQTKNWLHLSLGGTHPDKWGSQPNENAGKPITFHRSPLCVTIEVPGEKTAGAPPAAATQTPAVYTVTLFVVHQKSGKDGGYWREKEAARTVELAGDMTKADPERNIIVLGDFNATMGQNPMRVFTGAGFTDAFYPRLPGEQKKTPADASRARKGPDPTLISHASGRTYDHILFSPAALKELRVESRFILGLPTRPAGADYRTTEPPAGYASDHYPVVVDIVPKDQ